jgi:hypothetical protein
LAFLFRDIEFSTHVGTQTHSTGEALRLVIFRRRRSRELGLDFFQRQRGQEGLLRIAGSDLCLSDGSSGATSTLGPLPSRHAASQPNAFYFVDMFQAVKGTDRQGVGWTPQQKDAVTALAVKYVCSDAHPSRSSFKQKTAGTTPTKP